MKAHPSGSRQGKPLMKIERIAAYQVDLPLREGSYKWSGGKSVSVFDCTVVRIDTDQGCRQQPDRCERRESPPHVHGNGEGGVPARLGARPQGIGLLAADEHDALPRHTRPFHPILEDQEGRHGLHAA